MASVLLVGEHRAGTITADTLAAVSAAAQLGEVTVLVVGECARQAAAALTVLEGVSRVVIGDATSFRAESPEALACFIVSLHGERGFTHVASAASTYGRAIVPRVAALLDVGQVSDVLRIVDPRTFFRAMYAGNAIVKVKSRDEVTVLTIRVSSFEPAVPRATSQCVQIESYVIEAVGRAGRLVERAIAGPQRAQLVGAKVVVSGGRGMGSKANFKLLEPIADKLGAAIGASRAAVDAGFMSNEFQVGQTGKSVAPALYIAVGISGAVQHLAGMRDSRVIVAINKDSEAPIFGIADYGLVADLFDVLPQLDAGLDALVARRDSS